MAASFRAGMMRRRRREPETQQVRSPHPDPRVEQRLQHILALREVAAQQQQGVTDAYEEVKALRHKARSGDQVYASFRANAADSLAAKIPAMEKRIGVTFAEISALTDALSETDLAYL
jgi:hypothetical protein